MNDIDELERLARAALVRGQEDCEDLHDWFSQEEFMSNMLLHPVDARFTAACQPKTILELIAEMRRLRIDAERYRWTRQGKPFWVKVPVKDKFVEYFMGAKPEKRFPECLDSSVDAARAKEPA